VMGIPLAKLVGSGLQNQTNTFDMSPVRRCIRQVW
jgi:hypothetical protein